MVVVTILGALMTVGVNTLVELMDISRARSVSDRLYFALVRCRQAGRIISPANSSRVAPTVRNGVCLMRGTYDARGTQLPNAGFSALPYAAIDPILARPRAAWTIAVLNGSERTDLISFEPSVHFTRRWDPASSAFPPPPMATAVFLQWLDDGNLDENLTSTGALVREGSPFASADEHDAWTFDIVTASGYQRFRLSRDGSVNRSAWNDLAVTPPLSEGNVPF